jgi:serine/threonine protein kinase
VTTANPPRPPPARLGRYEVRAKIAEGGMATVFVGRIVGPQGVERVCALKVIRDEFSLNRDFVNMFLDEAKIVSRMKHPNIVELYELGVEGTRIFLAMELLFGQSLWHAWDACRERKVRLRYDVIAWIGAQVATGLHYAHDMRLPNGQPLELVHRDVNATNIFLTYDGAIKIIDFGLAKAVNRVSKTAAGVIKGKVAYMSPEQAIGSPVDRRTDVFALGTTLWELSVDRRLFKHTDEIETLKRVHAADVPDPTKLVDGYPPALWAVIQRALARDKEQRYATTAEMAHDLEEVSRSEGRVVGAATVAEVMRELFGHERERQARWLTDASAADSPAPKETLKPPAGFYRDDASALAAAMIPRDGSALAPELDDAARATFSPPARPPLIVTTAMPSASAPVAKTLNIVAAPVPTSPAVLLTPATAAVPLPATRPVPGGAASGTATVRSRRKDSVSAAPTGRSPTTIAAAILVALLIVVGVVLAVRLLG